MSSVRMTRRAKQRSQKQRHTYKQRGGAAWAPVFSSEEDERFKAWKEEIGGNDELKKLFPSLTLLDRNNATTDEEKQYRLLTYFNSMAHQDKLFRAALNIIRKKVSEKLGISSELTSETIISKSSQIDGYKSELIEYFRDVERIVVFEEDISGDMTKLRAMYNDNKYCTLSTLLLFPSRIENIFIMALSEIICNLIDNKTILEDASNESIALILATQYDSYAQALAHTLTAFPLRDGFFLNQGLEEISVLSMNEDKVKADITKIELQLKARIAQGYKIQLQEKLKQIKKQETFWKEFIKAAKLDIDISESKLFNNKSTDVSSCSNYISDNTYADITADMLLYATLNKENIDNMDVLDMIASRCESRSNIDTFNNREMIPDAVYDNVLIHGLPFKDILTNVDITTLEFLLHLEVAIKECWKRRKKAAATAAAPNL